MHTSKRTPEQEAFLSPSAGQLFTSQAVFSNAKDLSGVDVSEGHAAARSAIQSAIANTHRRIAAESSRIAVIKGEGGTGKTHTLATTLREAAADPNQDVLPVVLQVTAPVQVSEYTVWLVDAVFRELGARHFPDSQGRSPLRRLADKLLEQVSEDDQSEFLRFVGDLEDDGEIPLARDLGRRIREKGRETIVKEVPPAWFLSILLLVGYDDESAQSFLRKGYEDERTRILGARLPQSIQEKFDLLIYLGLTAEMLGMTLVFAFDQVENTVRLSSDELFGHVITQSVRIAHDLPAATVAVVVLAAAYDQLLSGSKGPSDTDRDRLERESPRMVMLERPSSEFLVQVIRKRLEVLMRTQGVDVPKGSQSMAPLPPALIQQIGEQRSVRHALRLVSHFREDVLLSGSWESKAKQPLLPTEDYDKLWADFHDSASVLEQKLLVHTKAELLRWWGEEAGQELSLPYHVIARTHQLEAPETHVIDFELKKGEDSLERRQLAICDATNRGSNLPNQIREFLEWSEAVPVVYRDRGFPKGKKALAAAALQELKESGGVIIEIGPSEWNSLKRGREFFQQHQSAKDFLQWRKEKRWLHQLVPPLEVLIAGSTGKMSETLEGGSSLVRSDDKDYEDKDTIDILPKSDNFPVYIGSAWEDKTKDRKSVYWDPYRSQPDHLNNFSMLVTGDSGAGKTQTICFLIAAACKENLPVLIFDFKADYIAPDFAEPLGLEVIDVRHQGLPFNPLKPPPAGASGAQPAEHSYELSGLLCRIFRMGAVQEGALRDAINSAYRAQGIEPSDWVEPDSLVWPTLADVLDVLREGDKTANIVTRLAPIVDMGLFPSTDSGLAFGDMIQRKTVLNLSGLPTDELKALLAEILIIQVHAHALRGEQPRKLARMMVFDEAHRVASSRRLETLGREGRAFGIGLVIGTQYPGDISDELAGSMATSLFLMNGQAEHRRAVVKRVYGGTSQSEARGLLQTLSGLRPLQGLFTNTHYARTLVDVLPYYRRKNAG